MRIGDVLLIILIAGGIMSVFTDMTTDSEIEDYYNNHSPWLNVTQRMDILRNDPTFANFSFSITNQSSGVRGKTVEMESSLEAVTAGTIGILAIPTAVLNGLKAIFDVLSLKWLTSSFALVEQMFGFQSGSLEFVRHIIMWAIIFLFIGAILRWRT